MEFLLSLPMEGFTRRTGIVLYRRRNRGFDPGRIRMVDNHKQGIRRVENYLHAIGIGKTYGAFYTGNQNYSHKIVLVSFFAVTTAIQNLMYN